MLAVAYDPEQYVVLYGKDPNVLENNSSIVSGTADITATAVVYSVMLSDLQANTDYYFKVVAMNGVGSNESITSQFSTPISGTMQ